MRILPPSTRLDDQRSLLTLFLVLLTFSLLVLPAHAGLSSWFSKKKKQPFQHPNPLDKHFFHVHLDVLSKGQPVELLTWEHFWVAERLFPKYYSELANGNSDGAHLKKKLQLLQRRFKTCKVSLTSLMETWRGKSKPFDLAFLKKMLQPKSPLRTPWNRAINQSEALFSETSLPRNYLAELPAEFRAAVVEDPAAASRVPLVLHLPYLRAETVPGGLNLTAMSLQHYLQENQRQLSPCILQKTFGMLMFVLEQVEAFQNQLLLRQLFKTLPLATATPRFLYKRTVDPEHRYTVPHDTHPADPAFLAFEVQRRQKELAFRLGALMPRLRGRLNSPAVSVSTATELTAKREIVLEQYCHLSTFLLAILNKPSRMKLAQSRPHTIHQAPQVLGTLYRSENTVLFRPPLTQALEHVLRADGGLDDPENQLLKLFLEWETDLIHAKKFILELESVFQHAELVDGRDFKFRLGYYQKYTKSKGQRIFRETAV